MAEQNQESTAQAHQECEQRARPVGSPFRYATLKLPLAQQQLLNALRALDLELAAISARIAEPQVAFAKLDWWRASLKQLTETHRAEHPILQALLDCAQKSQRLDWLDGQSGFVDGIEQRLGATQLEMEYQGFDREADLRAYLRARGGSMYQLYAQSLDIPVQRLTALRELGGLHHRIHSLQCLGRYLPSGQIYLPASLLARFNVAAEQSHQPEAIPEALLASECDHIQSEITKLLQDYPGRLPRFFRILQAINQALLNEMQKNPAALLETRPELTPFQHWWLAWRASF